MDKNLPAEIGMPVSDVDTPALLIDIDALERNIEKMALYGTQQGINLRPHAKTHKSIDIARMQVSNGAVGVCCQKVSEAEILIHGGITDVLITNQIIGQRKIRRLVELSQYGKISVCVDDSKNVTDINEMSAQCGTVIKAFVEVDIGSGRCGVNSGEATLALAKQIENSQNLEFGGLHAYNGSAQHIRDYHRRREATQQGLIKLSVIISQLKAEDIKVKTVTGAGTGTYPFETGSGLYTELQCGSYVFMDVDYGKIRMADGSLIGEFENSLCVLTAVMSKTSQKKAICDAGLKAHSVDSGLPIIADPRPITYAQASDEHGLLHDPLNILQLGEKLRIIPGHCDPTVNLFDWYVGVRDGRVEQLWPVSARGMVL